MQNSTSEPFETIIMCFRGGEESEVCLRFCGGKNFRVGGIFLFLLDFPSKATASEMGRPSGGSYTWHLNFDLKASDNDGPSLLMGRKRPVRSEIRRGCFKWSRSFVHFEQDRQAGSYNDLFEGDYLCLRARISRKHSSGSIELSEKIY